MDNEVFFNISKIIERDSKTTTYKFALLRGVIDIIQETIMSGGVTQNNYQFYKKEHIELLLNEYIVLKNKKD